MEQQFLTLKEALLIFKNKDAKGMYLPFDIEYRTFNEQTKKGGKLKAYKAVKYLPEAIETNSSKSPMHYENRTRNIELSTGEIRKVKIDFIISVNNIKVIY
ncbi:hypothetical protein LXD69_10170 [Flavobacterium sediminilitoris]|uniref:Uncharacterized protein n=1 Tax=Flavobacterium sediminilitoris TaxID=2024526 RepID=A0ABY4HJ93_9FLAO|nr:MULTISPECIES: hypothetical protein [Flavobacterium]UOX32417.1 hypothetical protein LXD69_10170 [Flavobacterium sediminilitoris]